MNKYFKGAKPYSSLEVKAKDSPTLDKLVVLFSLCRDSFHYSSLLFYYVICILKWNKKKYALCILV